MLILFLLDWDSVDDFSSIGTKAPTSAKSDSCLSAWRAMQFKLMIWMRVMVIFRWNFFSSIDPTLLLMSSSSFITKKIHPHHSKVRILHPASGKTPRWPVFGSFRFTSHSPCWIPWLHLQYACITLLPLKLLSSNNPLLYICVTMEEVWIL